jgi:hypothetical protein
MEAFIKSKGLAAAQTYAVGQLKTVGVDEAAILAKVGKEKIADLVLDDLVMLAADYKAIDNGDANASELFELKETKPAGAATDLKSKLKAQVDQAPKAEAKPESKAGKHMAVRLGEEAFTFMVNDGMKEYLVKDDGVALQCDCGVTKGPCPHTKAVEAFQNRS